MTESRKKPVEWALVWALLYVCAPLGQLGTYLAHDLHHLLNHESADHVHASNLSHAPEHHAPEHHAPESEGHSPAHGHGTTIDLLLAVFEHVASASTTLPDRDSNRHWEHVLPSKMEGPSFACVGSLCIDPTLAATLAADSIDHPPRHA